MPIQVRLTRILIDGGILTAIVGVVLVGMLYINPRIALSDYPADVKAAVPPRTMRELQLGILISIPLLLIAVALPLYSVWLVKQQCGGTRQSHLILSHYFQWIERIKGACLNFFGASSLTEGFSCPSDWLQFLHRLKI